MPVQHAGMVIDDAVPCCCRVDAEDLRAVGGHRPREMAAVTGACLLAHGPICSPSADSARCRSLQRRRPQPVPPPGQRVVFNPEAMLVHHRRQPKPVTRLGMGSLRPSLGSRRRPVSTAPSFVPMVTDDVLDHLLPASSRAGRLHAIPLGRTPGPSSKPRGHNGPSGSSA